MHSWYDTSSLTVLPPRYVSAVERQPGLLPCSAQKGLKGYRGEEPALTGLIRRVGGAGGWDRSIPLYSERGTSSPSGTTAEQGELSASCYDFLMSEARMMSYFAPPAWVQAPAAIGGDEPLHEPQRFLCRTPLLDRHHV